MRRAAAPVAAVLVLAAAALAGAAPASKVIGHAVRLKKTNIFYAQGKAVSPKELRATLVATPKQPVKVQWSVVCQKPNKADPAIQIDSGAKTGETSVAGAGTVELSLPYPKPPNCVATIYATLTRNGSLVLSILQT